MKNIYLILVTLIVLSITSCSTLKSGTEDHATSSGVSKERMQMDAYGMANLDCEYKLMELQLEENRDDKKLQFQFAQLQKDRNTFSGIINTRYRSSSYLNAEFGKLIKSAETELTTCKKLTEIEEGTVEESKEVKE